MPTTLVTDWRELADRSVDGLDVRLWWSSSSGRVQVTLADHRGGDHLVVVVDVDGADALDAFRHPFAYVNRADRLPRPRRHHLAPASGREEQ